MRVLVLGGYGHFGGRIVRTLARDARFDVVVAGRRLDAAHSFAASLDACANPVAVARVDVEADDVAQAIRSCLPALVVHTAGPFQARDYRVAEAAMACGAHYVDLADGRDFVAGIGALDAAAVRVGRWVVSGASSVPALSGAAIAAHLDRFAELRDIESGISPGNRTPRGLATTQAILGYVGQPYRVLRDGRWRRVHGWQSLRREHYPGIGTRWLARCEVPDLDVLPRRHPQLRGCDFRAGLELRRMHHGLWLASWLVRAGLVASMAPYAQRLLSISERWREAGSDTGVMHIDMRGIGHDGQVLGLRWRLDARNGDGPQVPCTAAVVLARKLADGALPGAGARACLDLFTLQEFLAALDGFAVETSLVRMD